jgi:glycogen operon protein
MAQRDWESRDQQVLGLFLNGDEIRARTADGQPVVDDSFLLLLNASPEPVTFVLPPRRFGARWEVDLRTDDPQAMSGSCPARGEIALVSRCLVVLRRTAR